MDKPIQLIANIIDLPEAQAEKFMKLCVQKSITKGQCFIREGQVPKKLALIENGLFRYYYINDNGIEFTKNFITEGHFISSYSAMIQQKPSSMFIEALEDSIVYEISYADWQHLKESHTCWKELLIYFLEKAFSIKEKRERELLLLDAEKRYTIFKLEFPGLEQRIKQHLIASYLGISPVSLSRIRKKNGVNIG